MREIRQSGSEGGAGQTKAPFLPLSVWVCCAMDLSFFAQHAGEFGGIVFCADGHQAEAVAF